MLFAPTAAKHDLTAPTVVGGLKKSNCGDVAQKKHQAAALITSGLRRLNQEQTQKQRQKHNQQNQQQQKQKQRVEQQQEQQSQNVELTQPQPQPQHQQQQQLQEKEKQQQQQKPQQHQVRDSCGHHNLHQNHVPNLTKNEQQQKQTYQQQPQQLEQQEKNQQFTMDAMKKLDAKLVAYLAVENLTSCTDPTMDEEESAKVTEELCFSNRSLTATASAIMSPLAECRMYRDKQLNLFKRISGIQLQMEALTLNPEGTKRMELLQNDLRPIFTVECQLSHELIKAVPRYDMFHVMQFESEKFHSLTQCTRFGQEAKRAVKLELMPDAINNNNNKNINIDDKPELGRIHFTVWWREPGTCLNEMLGMGVLALEELYEASVLEQCKRIVIQRRKMHLANLYFKISLQTEAIIQEEKPQTIEANMSTLNGAAYTSSKDDINGVKFTTNVLNTTGSSQSNQESGNGGSNNNNNKNNSNENNVQIETTHFIAETSRVRLLRGLIYANEVRQLDLNTNHDYLICRRFWEDDLAVIPAGNNNKFNYQEQFAILNDDAFLRRVDRQYLQLEVWRRQPLSDADGNGNGAIKTDDIQPVGLVQLPLHQFFIAYRDVAITNHLCKGKMPVISFDAWAPITSFCEAGTPIGELRCLLAIGSDEQIAKLKETHGFNGEPNELREIEVDKTLFSERSVAPPLVTNITGTATSTTSAQTQVRSTANLLEFLQRSLAAQPSSVGNPPSRMPPEVDTTTASATMPPSLLKPLHAPNVKSFRFLLEIQRANGLPRNPGARGKKSSKRNSANKQQRFPPNEAPSTYVTFQADDGHGPVYKSHEGAVYATNIAEKTTQPQWQQRFRISASMEYLLNPQKRFILKIWKKATTDSPQKRQQPTPLDDAIVGFAALDLSVFLRGLYIAGCFNIVDFNGRINGQLEVRSQPLEDVQKLMSPAALSQQISTTNLLSATASSGQSSIDSVIDQFDNTLDIAHLNLGQAIKRKFTELEGISQRLRTRLVDVTGEQLAPEFNASLLDNWQAERDNNAGNSGEFDEFDEFEHDINTAPGTPPPTPLQLQPSIITPAISIGTDVNVVAQNDKTQFKIASVASAKVEAERNDATESMTPKE